jgi:hypothetical protein
MNKVQKRLMRAVTTAVALLIVAGLAGSALAGSKLSMQQSSGPYFSNQSFCGRYVSSYTAIYQSTAGLPPTLTTPLSALEASVITADGHGNLVNGELTQNAPANLPQSCSIVGNSTYTVSASPLSGVPGYLTMNPSYACTGYTAVSCATGVCELDTPFSTLGETIQFACYLSDPAGNQVVCSELGNTFTDNSFSARAITFVRTSAPVTCPAAK